MHFYIVFFVQVTAAQESAVGNGSETDLSHR